MRVDVPAFLDTINKYAGIYVTPPPPRLLGQRLSRLSWLPVEGLCAGLGANGNHSLKEAEGRELVLFGGKVYVG